MSSARNVSEVKANGARVYIAQDRIKRVFPEDTGKVLLFQLH